MHASFINIAVYQPTEEPTYQQQELLEEGAVVQVIVNKYERNQKARIACLAHYGPTCVVCGLNFREQYNELDSDLVHIHHIKPLHEFGKSYVVDPIKDLVPVCMNCHAVINSARPALSIEAVKRMLRKRN